MLPLVIDYLKTHTLKQLTDEFSVRSSMSRDLKRIVLNYSSDAPKGVKLTDECRGIVISIDNENLTEDELRNNILKDVRLLARPMVRFYNNGAYEDAYVAKIDWSTARAFEKLDGTMIIVYYDEQSSTWRCSTRNNPDANQEVNGYTFKKYKFFELFWKGISKSGDYFDLSDKGFKKEYTYVVELTSPYNRVIVKYDLIECTLLAAIHTETGNELDIKSVGWDLKLPKLWKLPDAKIISELVSSYEPTELEGVVVVDSKFNRAKIKNISWMEASHMKSQVASPRKLFNAITLKKIDSYVRFLPKEDVDRIVALRFVYEKYVAELDEHYRLCKASSYDKKSFANEVNKLPNIFWAVLFNMYRYNTEGSETVQMMVNNGHNTFVDKLVFYLMSNID